MGNDAGDDFGKSYPENKNSTAGFTGDRFGKKNSDEDGI
jgi:hypothetical protein